MTKVVYIESLSVFQFVQQRVHLSQVEAPVEYWDGLLSHQWYAAWHLGADLNWR